MVTARRATTASPGGRGRRVGAPRRALGALTAVACGVAVVVVPATPTPVAADPSLPITVDSGSVTVVDERVTVVDGAVLEIPFVNRQPSGIDLGGYSLFVDFNDTTAGTPTANVLDGMGVDIAVVGANSSNVELSFTSRDGAVPCRGTLAAGASCLVEVELTDPIRPAGARLELVDSAGVVVGSTYVLWVAPAQRGDRLDTSFFAGTFGVGDSIGVLAASTAGLTAEPGEPAHAGTAARGSWWASLEFAGQGRLDLTVQALDAPYPGGMVTTTPIRAQLYRSTAIPPTMASLVRLAPSAAGAGPGTLTLSSNVNAGATYYLAVDADSGTDFSVSGTFTGGGTGFDPDATDPVPARTFQLPADGTPAPVFTVYNETPPPFEFTLPELTGFVWHDASDANGRCAPTDGSTFPTAGPVTMLADPGAACVAEVAAVPLAPGATVEEIVTVDGDNGIPQSVEYVLRASAPVGAGPTNDTFASAQDISTLAIPAYVAGPQGQPVDTASVSGTTVGATRELEEYGLIREIGRPDVEPTTGTVWFRYTAPPGGFTGRLGYRVSDGFTVTPLAMGAGDTRPPSPRFDVIRFAPGNTWPPSGLSFARMEPGHTVWFQVSARTNNFSGDREPDGEFVLELYQAPNEQDTIVNAYDIELGQPWPQGLNWIGDGDTFHLTADAAGGPANGWFTATFDRPGFWGFTARSENARGEFSSRPLGLRLYRSPTSSPLTDPTALGAPIASTAGELRDIEVDFVGTIVPVWEASLRNIPVEPGRYYWTFERGASGPTFFSLNGTYTALPRAIATVTDCAGDPKRTSFNTEFVAGGLPFGVPAAPTNVESVHSAVGDGFTLSARVDAGVGDAPGDGASTTCSPSAVVEGAFRLDAAPGVTDPVPVGVQVLREATATEILGSVVGGTDVLADAGMVGTVTITDPDTNLPVYTYEHRVDRTTRVTPGGSATSTATTRTRVDGASVPGRPDTNATGTVACASGSCTVTPPTTELGPDTVTVTVPLRPGVMYRYRITLAATVTARSADQTGAALTGVLLDGGNDDFFGNRDPGISLAFAAPIGTSLACSSRSNGCPVATPEVTPPDTTPPTLSISGIAPGSTVTATAEPSVTIESDEPLAAIECTLDVTRDDTGASTSNPEPCDLGSFTFPELPDGEITLTVTGTDAAGNTSTTSLTFGVQLDPVATITAPVDGATYIAGSVPALAYTCTDNGSIDSEQLSVGANGDPWPGAPPSTPGVWRINLDCLDGAGNGGTTSVTYTVIPDPAAGPCVLIDTTTADFGQVQVGSSQEAPVTVRSCSSSPQSLAVQVTPASVQDGQSPVTWTVGPTTSTPGNGQFTWATRSGPVPGVFTPVGTAPVTLPGTLASFASRTDTHRLTLGPTGPGLGRPFATTITYLATANP